MAFLILLSVLTDAFDTEGVETFFTGAGATDVAAGSFTAGSGVAAGCEAAFLAYSQCFFHTFPIINLLTMVSVISFKK